MSSIKENTIQGVGSDGGSTIKVKEDSTFISDGGAVTDTNLVQGLCKQWVLLQSDGNSVTDSFNNSSVTDNNTGDYTLTRTNNMANATYPTPWNAHDGSHYLTVSQGWDKTTASWKNARSGGDFSTKVDADDNGETVFGDLA